MKSLVFSVSAEVPNCINRDCSITHAKLPISIAALNLPNSSRLFHSLNLKVSGHLRCVSGSQPRSNPQSNGKEEEDTERLVQDLRVPNHWLLPSKALEESEWLKVALHKWLDDEYCPEATNVEISKVAANSYHESLLDERTDLGEILLKMARELESTSYQESFHGAFSSANAAVNLIVQRIEQG